MLAGGQAGCCGIQLVPQVFLEKGVQSIRPGQATLHDGVAWQRCMAFMGREVREPQPESHAILLRDIRDASHAARVIFRRLVCLSLRWVPAVVLVRYLYQFYAAPFFPLQSSLRDCCNHCLVVGCGVEQSVGAGSAARFFHLRSANGAPLFRHPPHQLHQRRNHFHQRLANHHHGDGFACVGGKQHPFFMEFGRGHVG